MRCYDKVIDHIQQRRTNNPINEEEDDETLSMNRKTKHNDGKIIFKIFL